MNAITQALQTAGVKLPPLNKRVWLWLHDHPGKTSKEVAVAIGAEHANVSSQLNLMFKRRMVQGTQQPQRGRKGMEWHYETCIKQFELLPMRKARKAVHAKDDYSIPYAVTGTPVVEAPKPVRTPLEAIPAPLLATLEKYTLGELRLIRDGLNFLFGGVK